MQKIQKNPRQQFFKKLEKPYFGTIWGCFRPKKPKQDFFSKIQLSHKISKSLFKLETVSSCKNQKTPAHVSSEKTNGQTNRKTDQE